MSLCSFAITKSQHEVYADKLSGKTPKARGERAPKLATPTTGTKSRVSAVYIISSDDKYYGGNKSGKGGLGRAGVRIGCNLRGWQKSSLGRWVAQ